MNSHGNNNISHFDLVIWSLSKLDKEYNELKEKMTELELVSQMKENLLQKRNENLVLKVRRLEDKLEKLTKDYDPSDYNSREYQDPEDREDREDMFSMTRNDGKLDIDSALDFLSDEE